MMSKTVKEERRKLARTNWEVREGIIYKELIDNAGLERADIIIQLFEEIYTVGFLQGFKHGEKG